MGNTTSAFYCRIPARMRCQGAALLAVIAAFAIPVNAQAPASLPDGIASHINTVLYSTEVQQHIRAWGLTIADVQHDVDAMSLEQRARLALELSRPWRGTGSQSPAAVQAQFLVMMSLMRESTLFARVIASRPARLLR